MLSAAFSSDVMTVLKRESVAMLVEHAAAFKSRDSLSDGLEIIKEAAVGCLRNLRQTKNDITKHAIGGCRSALRP